MLGSQRRSIEREQPAALEDAIEDGLRQVLIVQHTSPGGERFVRREDHGALLPMPVVDDVEEHVCGIGAVGEVAHFVADEDTGLHVGGQDLGEAAAPEGRRQVVNQLGGGDEAGIKAILDRAISNRDGQMRFAPSRFAGQNHTAPLGHKLRGEG